MGSQAQVLGGTSSFADRLAPAMRQVGRASRKNPIMVAGIVLMVAMVIIGLIAPLITSRGPTEIDAFQRLLGPSSDNWFGTDSIGRDVYSRTMYGARVSLGVGFAVAVSTMLAGVVIGLVAGYYRRADMIVMRIMDAMLAIPFLLLAIALMAILGASIKNVIISLLIVMTPSTARVVRSSVLSLREEVYVDAARAIGAPDWRVIFRHILPGTIAPLIIQGTYTMAIAILVEASLSFLGAGSPPTTPSWGVIMADGRAFVRVAIWMIMFPGIFLFITILGINLAGDGLRDILDPKLQRRD